MRLKSNSLRDPQIEKEYASDEDEDDTSQTHSDSDEAPELLTTREDFTAMMNEFMEEYEILGGKMKPVLAGDSAMDKLETMRRGMGQVSIRDQGDEDDDERDILIPLEDNDVKDRWDCETILSKDMRLCQAHILIIFQQRIAISKTTLG